jgi:methylamine dehydrogenase heavy chain
VSTVQGSWRAAVLVAALAAVGASSGRAELPLESPGGSARVGPPTAHWVWIGDLILERVQLVDLDAGRFLGTIQIGYGMSQPLVSRRRPEIYVPATYYSRRTRGARTDALEIYDASTLAPVGEVELPAHRAIDNFALAHATLTDDERFAAIFNWTPATSLSIVDVEARRFVGEVPIPGCSLVYAAGTRRLLSLCADGSFLVTTLDDAGHLRDARRTAPFFEPTDDPVTEKAVRVGDRWIFVSFAGRVYEVTVGPDGVHVAAPWTLDAGPASGVAWRTGGVQHLAAHAASNRLYALMHRGGPDTHKDPGDEVWVFDLATHRRTARIPLRAPGFTIMGQRADVWRDWAWPFDRVVAWAVDRFMPPTVTQIAVTPGASPLLVTSSRFTGGIGVYDATDGRFVKRVQPVGWTLDVITTLHPGGSS